jgi:DNA-binding FadR family transcriptional regulator
MVATAADVTRLPCRQLSAIAGRCNGPVRRRQLDTTFHTTIVAAAGNRQPTDLTEQLRTGLSRYGLAYMRQIPDRHHADGRRQEALAAIASAGPIVPLACSPATGTTAWAAS